MKKKNWGERFWVVWLAVYAGGFVLFKDQHIGSYWLQFWLAGAGIGWLANRSNLAR